MNREELLNHLEFETQVFKNKAIKKAFEAIDRKDFVMPDYEFEAYEDYALPTFNGETITQPTLVAFMLELLDTQEGDSVLDIGSGSGWTTALLAHMAGNEGNVYGVEIQPELIKQGKANLAKYKKLKLNAEIVEAGEDTGLYTHAPYNRIIASVAFDDKENIIPELLLQLVPGGIMVAPVNDTLIKFEKISDDEIEETEYPGFNFSSYRV